jgi:hypothetical protein
MPGFCSDAGPAVRAVGTSSTGGADESREVIETIEDVIDKVFG